MWRLTKIIKHKKASRSAQLSKAYKNTTIKIVLAEQQAKICRSWLPDCCKGRLIIDVYLLKASSTVEWKSHFTGVNKKDWDNTRSVAQKPIAQHPLVQVSWAGRNASVLSPYWRMFCTTLNKDGSCGARTMQPLFLPKQNCTAKTIFSFPSKL